MLFAALAHAQSIEIYSELQRPNPFGRIVSADRAWKPREILSPAVGRGGYASFHIAVSVPTKESYFLYVITNPLTACRVDLYKEHFVRVGGEWIPDRLTPIERLPDFGVMPDPDDHIEGQSTRAYLLDLWLPPNADVARFRLEVQLKMANWTIRPMEIRVVPARFPELRAGPAGALPPVESAAGAAATAVMSEYFAARPFTAEPPPLSVRSILRRNAIQDMALAGSIGLETAGPAAVRRRALELFSWNARYPVWPLGAEWYLKVRDWLFTLR